MIILNIVFLVVDKVLMKIKFSLVYDEGVVRERKVELSFLCDIRFR